MTVNPDYLPDDTSVTFTFPCKDCGVTVHVVDTIEWPHHCRIDLDAQRGITFPPDTPSETAR